MGEDGCGERLKGVGGESMDNTSKGKTKFHCSKKQNNKPTYHIVTLLFAGLFLRGLLSFRHLGLFHKLIFYDIGALFSLLAVFLVALSLLLLEMLRHLFFALWLHVLQLLTQLFSQSVNRFCSCSVFGGVGEGDGPLWEMIRKTINMRASIMHTVVPHNLNKNKWRKTNLFH